MRTRVQFPSEAQVRGEIPQTWAFVIGEINRRRNNSATTRVASVTATGWPVVLPIMISVVAALISAVSAWTSIRQSRLARRSRLGQLVDEISKADLEYNRLLADNDDRVADTVVIAFNDRQEILARQALRLLSSFRRAATSREVEVVANALEHLGDYPHARQLYQRAVARARREGPSSESSARERHGIFLFRAGKPTEGSAELARAADVLGEPTGDRLLRRRFDVLAMRAVQHVRHGYDLPQAERLLNEAAGLVDRVTEDVYREEMREALRDYRDQLRTHGSKTAPGGRRRGITPPAVPRRTARDGR